MTKVFVGSTGGKRNPLKERWDVLPGLHSSLSEVAKVAYAGEERWGFENWKELNCRSDQAPINHALAHSFKALEYPPGTPDRVYQLAKAAWNLLAQIWFEKRHGAAMEALTVERLEQEAEEAADLEADTETAKLGSVSNWFASLGAKE